ncbi:MAG: aspartate kinase [Actinomycetota bacterium]|nr:aspartate kinase [Actinomycetota bacterium]
MSLVVQKFGGTSVADPERIQEVAAHVVRTREEGHEVVVVVSAMGKTTDELLQLAHEISPNPHRRELDMLQTAGERISTALLCIAIWDRGVPATSLTGSQAGIVTDAAHGRAKIIEVKADRLREALGAGHVVVVAGFQGVSVTRDITTLGRGGSDTTAVALAAALQADVCEIYNDVAGVYTADPRVVPNARMLRSTTYEEMLDIADTGGRVLALRAVEFARNYNVPLHVRSSFTWEPGTWIGKETEDMEQPVISAISHDTSEAKVTVQAVPDSPGIAARLFRPLADQGINVDMIVQNTSVHGTTDISFTVPMADLPTGLKVTEEVAGDIGAQQVTHDTEIGRVSLVGAGMKTNPGIAAQVFEVLADEGINVEMISTSTIVISCVVRASAVEPAVRALHEAFELGEIMESG